MTIRPFSKYQVIMVSHYSSLCSIEKIGFVDETGEIIMEYSTPFDKIPVTIKIPREKPLASEEAEFEIIQPKQLK